MFIAVWPCIFLLHSRTTSFGKDTVEGYRLGQAALLICERFQAKPFLSRLFAGYYGSVHSWARPVAETIEPLRRAHRLGLETGDIEFAFINCCILVWQQHFRTALPRLNDEILEYTDAMEFFGQEMALIMIKPAWQFIQNMLGLFTEDPCTLTGSVMNEGEITVWKQWHVHVESWTAYYKIVLCFLFGKQDLGETFIDQCQSILNLPFSPEDMVDIWFFTTMTLIVQGRLSRRAKRQRLVRIKRGIKKVRYYATLSPFNYLSRLFLLEAEYHVLCGKTRSALPKYVSAIAHAKEEGFLLHTALAHERLGIFYNDMHNDAEARNQFEAALVHYDKYGATAKHAHLSAQMKFL